MFINIILDNVRDPCEENNEWAPLLKWRNGQSKETLYKINENTFII